MASKLTLNVSRTSLRSVSRSCPHFGIVVISAVRMLSKSADFSSDSARMTKSAEEPAFSQSICIVYRERTALFREVNVVSGYIAVTEAQAFGKPHVRRLSVSRSDSKTMRSFSSRAKFFAIAPASFRLSSSRILRSFFYSPDCAQCSYTTLRRNRRCATTAHNAPIFIHSFLDVNSMTYDCEKRGGELTNRSASSGYGATAHHRALSRCNTTSQ